MRLCKGRALPRTRLLPILAASAVAVLLAGPTLADEPYRPLIPPPGVVHEKLQQFRQMGRWLHDTHERERAAWADFHRDQQLFDLERRLDALERDREIMR